MGADKVSEAIGNLLASFEVFNEQVVAESLSDYSQGIVDAELKSEMERISMRCPSYESALEFAARLSLLQRAFYKAAPKAIEDVIHVAASQFLGETKLSPAESPGRLDDDQAFQVFGPVMMKLIQQRVSVHFQDLNVLLASSVKSEAKQSAVRHGSNGGQKRAEKFEPLKLRALELARAGRFSSANHAATQIAPKILEMPEAKSIAFSSERAVQTIATWLRKEGVPFSKQRASSLDDESV
ncbi:hypothetical protein [Burkholderia gladioli]|uniref:hypothetical protein n=1 Tax=Burkholderia gladioli TaxID=28095 RepID=UPI001640A9E2|nr:hypothetical protein [Burkholderia gladioli]